MALANDNYYGYALKLLVEKRITWLECAAASLVWTTIMVYYLEKPYGHLMLDEMEDAPARTTARGTKPITKAATAAYRATSTSCRLLPWMPLKRSSSLIG